MRILSNLLNDVGRIVENLSLSAREKQQLQTRVTEIFLRWEAEGQERQEKILAAEAGGN